MPKFLVTLHHADDYDSSTEGPEMEKAIDDLNDEMVAAGVRIFVGGLQHASQAKSVNVFRGNMYLYDNPLWTGNEHAAGIWILECKDLEEAVEWGKKAAIACQNPVEVRQFH